MSDPQRDAVLQWGKERGLALLHRSSAFGTTTDYEYAEAVLGLVEEFAEKFPGCPLGLVDAVRYGMRTGRRDLNLAEVNRLRAEMELPPLIELGRVDPWPTFTPPMPG